MSFTYIHKYIDVNLVGEMMEHPWWYETMIASRNSLSFTCFFKFQ